MMKFKGKVLTSVVSIALTGAVAGLVATSCSSKIDPYSVDLSIDPTGATIKFWTPFGSAINTVLDGMIEEFTEKTGINVVVEEKSGYDNLKKAISLAATSGQYPNVTVGYPDHFVEYVTSDIIVRLDYYFANDSKAFGEYPVSITDYYQDYMVENQSIEYDLDGKGYTLGIPFNKSSEIMIYNETFFEYAMVVDPTIEIPTTWAEVASVGPKIKTVIEPACGKVIGNNYQIYDDDLHYPTGVTTFLDLRETEYDSFRPIAYDSQANLFISAMRNWGSKYTERASMTSNKGYVVYNETDTKDKTKEAMQTFRDLYAAGILGVPKTWQETSYSSNVFKNVECVMTIGSTAGVGNDAPAGGKFTTLSAPVPYNDASVGKNVISQGTNLCMLDTGTAKERCATWLFMKYFSKFANAEFCSQTGYFPSCSYAEESTVYQDFINRTGRMTESEKIQIAAAKTNSSIYLNESEGWTKFVDTPFDGSAYIRENIETIPTRTMFETTDLQTILDESYLAFDPYGYVKH
ncbi:MAG: extracellular solute-binding protein [Bacilli bacterium]|jgi:multiple sugar transport system substrate-binding protein